MELINVRIASKTVLALDIAGFELVAADGGALPPFSAGAHIDVHIGPGLVRQYSLCNAPGETRRYQIAVLREPASRGGSIAMHDRVQVGDTLRISAPRNHFALHVAPRTLLFAGGIGITPILSMASQLARDGSVFALHYCARSASRAAFAGVAAGFGQLYLDDGGDRMDLPALLRDPDADTHLYVCGPAGFIDYVTGTARSLGWAPDRVHQEYFAGAAVDTSGDSSFEVLLASSGKVVPVAAHQSIVQALATQGVEIEVSCEQGVCGTCVTRVLDGVPDHRDSYFTDAEKRANDQCTPCCSRALSARLVLDL